MNYPTKVEGAPCDENCGGKNVKNPKTGKIFCENKCWLNGGKPATTEDVPFKTSSENSKEKDDNMAWGNAKHCASRLIIGEKYEDMDVMCMDFHKLAGLIYKMNKPS